MVSPRRNNLELSQTEKRSSKDAIHVDGQVNRKNVRSASKGPHGGHRQSRAGSRQGWLRDGPGGWLTANLKWHARPTFRREADRHGRSVHRGQRSDRRLCNLRREVEGAYAQMDRALHGVTPDAYAGLGG